MDVMAALSRHFMSVHNLSKLVALALLPLLLSLSMGTSGVGSQSISSITSANSQQQQRSQQGRQPQFASSSTLSGGGGRQPYTNDLYGGSAMGSGSFLPGSPNPQLPPSLQVQPNPNYLAMAAAAGGGMGGQAGMLRDPQQQQLWARQYDPHQRWMNMQAGQGGASPFNGVNSPGGGLNSYNPAAQGNPLYRGTNAMGAGGLLPFQQPPYIPQAAGGGSPSMYPGMEQGGGFNPSASPSRFASMMDDAGRFRPELRQPNSPGGLGNNPQRGGMGPSPYSGPFAYYNSAVRTPTGLMASLAASLMAMSIAVKMAQAFQ